MMTSTDQPTYTPRARIDSWRCAMQAEASSLGVVVSFPGPAEEMHLKVRLSDHPDEHRALQLRALGDTIYLLPSANINISIGRMVAISEGLTKAHKDWASANP